MQSIINYKRDNGTGLNQIAYILYFNKLLVLASS